MLIAYYYYAELGIATCGRFKDIIIRNVFLILHHAGDEAPGLITQHTTEIPELSICTSNISRWIFQQ